jgi:hypothetical protein
MYGLYNDDVKRTCSPITDTMCVKYKKKKKLLLFWACKSCAVTLADQGIEAIESEDSSRK